VNEEKNMKPTIKAELTLIPVTLSLLVALIAGILSPGTASADTYYVATDGSDDDSGTQDAPFRTIEHGVSVLQAGDTLRIKGGTYAESFTWWHGVGTSWSDSIMIEAAPGEEVVWEVPTGAQVALNILDVHYVVVRGIIFDGTNGSNRMLELGYTTLPVSGAEMLLSLNCVSNDPNQCAHHVRFEENEFRYAAYAAAKSSDYANSLDFVNNYIHHTGKVQNCNVFYIPSPNSIFDGNRFNDISCTAIAFWNPDGSTARDGIIRNNFIVRAGRFWASEGTYENSNAPIQADTVNLNGAGIFVSRGGGAKVYNNIIVDSPGGIWAGHNVMDCLIANNTIYGNTASGNGDPDYNAGIILDDLAGGSRDCTVQNNIVYQPGVTSPRPIVDLGANNTFSNNLTSDPLFVDPSAHDFHLLEDSPAIGEGTALAEVTEDYDGVLRPQGNAYDIGAYEF
jgi:hypothetical protein